MLALCWRMLAQRQLSFSPEVRDKNSFRKASAATEPANKVGTTTPRQRRPQPGGGFLPPGDGFAAAGRGPARGFEGAGAGAGLPCGSQPGAVNGLDGFDWGSRREEKETREGMKVHLTHAAVRKAGNLLNTRKLPRPFQQVCLPLGACHSQIG